MHIVTSREAPAGGSQSSGAAEPHFEILSSVFRADNRDSSAARTAMLMNIGADDPAFGAATALGAAPMNDDLRAVCQLLGFRGILTSDGWTVLAAASHDDAKSYYDLYTRLGWLSQGETGRVPEPFERIFWVESLTDLGTVLAAMAKEGTKVHPYIEPPAIHHIAAGFGAQVHGMGKDASQRVVGRLGNKINYRDWLEAHAVSPVFEYPRATFRAGEDLGTAAENLDQALRYAAGYQRPSCPRPVLFMQLGESGGGFGNRIIYERADGGFEMKGFGLTEKDSGAVKFDSADDIIQFARDLQRDLEITPFLTVKDTFIVIALAGDDGATVMGPFGQYTDEHENHEYQGFHLSREPKLNHTWMEAIIDREKKNALELQRMGYRGYYSVDYHVYERPDGQSACAPSEMNARRGAVSLMLSPLTASPVARDMLSRGELSIRTNEHFKISTALMGELKNSEGVARRIEELGVPMAKWNHPVGAMFLTPPTALKAGAPVQMTLAIVAHDDAERDRWYEILKTGLGHEQPDT